MVVMSFPKKIFIITLLVIGTTLSILTGKFLARKQTLEIRSKAVQESSTKIPPWADFDKNGVVDEVDYQIFLQKFENQDLAADLDGSGQINSLDLNLFLKFKK